MSRLARILAVLTLAAAPVLLTASSASADTDDFTIESFTADYYLDRDDGGRSTLRTVETIVAVFPEFDQNHGIIRHLVDDYQGHPTNIDVESVTDENGNDLPYESESDDTFLSLQIGDGDVYVHGATTYVITYTSHNVTLFNETHEEFYWDTNGTGWPQRVDTLTARFHIADALTAALNGDVACYQGTQGADGSCEATATDDGFEVTATELGAFENVTVAIGFEPGTFVPRDSSATGTPIFYIEIAATVVALLIALQSLVRRATVFANGRGRPTIVAEYLPPKNASVLEAALVTGRRKKAVAAQLISMAVAHNIRIIESPATGFFAAGNDYTLELLSVDGLTSDEAALARVFFGNGLAVGTQYTISKTDTVVGKGTYDLIQSIDGALDSRGWLKPISAAKRFFPAAFVILATVLGFVMMVVMIDDERGGMLPFLIWIPAVVATIVTFAVIARRVLSEKGAELRDYLKGLLLYIQVAETDRLRMLQSPEGAERTPVDTNDRAAVLKLYERVLPYAVLFDEEKRWAKVLGEFYDQAPPDWYSGTGVFTTAAFASSIGSISTTAASAYSGFSSSSGGSGGGGSSGGGGGGGGGGGW